MKQLRNNYRIHKNIIAKYEHHPATRAEYGLVAEYPESIVTDDQVTSFKTDLADRCYSKAQIFF